MREQMYDLIELQRFDSDITHLHLKKKELPRKLSELEEVFGSRTRKFQESRERLEKAGKAHKEREDALKKGLESLKKTKERLQEVKTNKEYQAMLKEIETINEKNGKIEDEIIVLLDELDKARDELNAEEKQFDSVRQVFEREKAAVIEQVGRIDGELSALNGRAAKMKEKISPALLKKYEVIKARTDGRAVVPVWKEVCEGCHMNIPPQMYIELQRSDELTTCPFCSRIIYWDAERASEALDKVQIKAQ